MSNKLIKYKFRNESFAGYGLNKYKNFLSAPMCECGCGEPCNLVLRDTKELFGFMNTMLFENDCDCCAIFAHSYDGKMYAAIKYIADESEDDMTLDHVNEKESVKFFGIDVEDLEFFQEWDATLGLHCYGLLIETKKGNWKIIED